MQRSANQFSRCKFQTIYSPVSHEKSRKVKSSVNSLMFDLGFNLEYIILVLPEDKDYVTDQFGVEHRFLAFVGSVRGYRLIHFFIRPEKGLLKIGDYHIGRRHCSRSRFNEDKYLKKRLTEEELRLLAESLVTQYALNGVWNN